MNIISIDGGGTRGVIVMRLLKEIIERSQQILGRDLHVIDLFDFFCGSSIGTVIISGLLIPNPNDPTKPLYTVNQVLDHFIKAAPKVFECSVMYNVWSLWGWRRPRYSNDNWKAFLIKMFGETTFGKLMKPVVFPVKDTLGDRPIYFHSTDPKHACLKIWEVLLGTTAAPTYFPSFELTIDGKKCNLIDGGVLVNDTSELAFIEAVHGASYDPKTIYEVSFGTGETKLTFEPNWWGALQWITIISDSLIASNSQNQAYTLSLMAGDGQYNRLNPHIPNNLNYLDAPIFIPKYLELTETWIKNNSPIIDLIVRKLVTNKGFTISAVVPFKENIDTDDLQLEMLP